MLRVNPVNRQELLKRLTFHPKSLVFKTVSVPAATGGNRRRVRRHMVILKIFAKTL